MVEFGNALYQDVIDRFVQGQQVAYEELRKVWQDTTQHGTVWDRPIYGAFYRAVRDVNTTLPAERQLRVLLGDPPIDWDDPKSRSGALRTDDFPVSIIQREVMSKNRRALDLRGHAPDPKAHAFPATEGSSIGAGGGSVHQSIQNGSIVAQLDRLGARVFVVSTSTDFDISTVQENVVTWRRPSLALIRGTPLGLASSVNYFSRSAPVIRGRGRRSLIAACRGSCARIPSISRCVWSG